MSSGLLSPTFAEEVRQIIFRSWARWLLIPAWALSLTIVVLSWVGLRAQWTATITDVAIPTVMWGSLAVVYVIAWMRVRNRERQTSADGQMR